MLRKWLQFPPPLHVAVLLLMLACGAVCFLIQLLLVEVWQTDSFVKQQQRGADFFVTRVARKLPPKSEKQLERLTRADMELLRAFPSLRWAGACDAEGRFVQCTKDEWVGKKLDDVAPLAAVGLAAQARLTREVVFHAEGDESVIAAKRIPDSLEEPMQYIALAERDVSEAMAARRGGAREAALTGAAMFGVFCLLVWGILFGFLRHRMQMFVKHAALTGGTRAPTSPLFGSDEFSEISRVLHEAESQLRDVAENLDEVIWILGADMKPLFVSSSYARIFMRTAEDVVRDESSMPDYIHEEFRPRIAHALQEVRAGAPRFDLEYKITRGDGQVRWIMSRGFAVRDAAGSLKRIVGTSRDVTEEVRLREQIVSISEQERQNVSYDLHDDACQRLAAMKLKSETLAASLGESQGAQHKLAVELKMQIAGTSALLRNIARGLAPVELKGGGLIPALRKLVQMQEAIYEVACFFHEGNSVEVASPVAATNLYRIAQEFIANAARHADPTQIDVYLDEVDNQIRLIVANDGRPFEPAGANHEGMGLKIVRYRAGVIEAVVDIGPRTDGTQGTIAECRVPKSVCADAGRV